MGMPTRQISPQSFDEILSELGDDPAIPDPHGIRKPSSPKPHPKPEIPRHIPSPEDLKKIALFTGIGIGVIGLILALFTSYGPMNLPQDTHLQETQKDLFELKKEFASLREEILEIEYGLNESIELLEVSVHSFNKSKTLVNSKPKPQAIPFETELRGWRYLGFSQVGSSQRAFFHNGKGTIMLEKGSPALGEWKLTNLDKELASFSHAQGKSFTLKPSKAE